jgi:hypothetical protein
MESPEKKSNVNPEDKETLKALGREEGTNNVPSSEAGICVVN